MSRLVLERVVKMMRMSRAWELRDGIRSKRDQGTLRRRKVEVTWWWQVGTEIRLTSGDGVSGDGGLT
jgi:hypothetical protein